MTLEGTFVRLVPLELEHRDAVNEAASDPRIWSFTQLTPIEDLLEEERSGQAFPFAVIARETGSLIGSTRFLDVSDAHRGVEIGGTWYTPDAWGTVVNPEAKYLLLRHAFEHWGAIRVYFKTDSRNLRSQAAIRKLGAQYEGTLRNHRILPDGYRRASVYFSILDDEWPAVKARLEERIACFNR